MAVRTQPRFSFTNRLLTALPPREYKRLASHLELVFLEARQLLSQAQEPLTQIYFPETVVLSIIYCPQDGRTIEVGMVGNEGVVELRALLGASALPYQSLTLTRGTAYRIPAKMFTAECKRGGVLQAVLLSYMQARLLQFAQIHACNYLHFTLQRVCRWLLMVHDRSRSDELSLTQEAIAQLLRVRRTGITEAVGSLQKKKLISSRYGHLTIRNRARLESAACECYGIINQGYKDVLK